VHAGDVRKFLWSTFYKPAMPSSFSTCQSAPELLSSALVLMKAQKSSIRHMRCNTCSLSRASDFYNICVLGKMAALTKDWLATTNFHAATSWSLAHIGVASQPLVQTAGIAPPQHCVPHLTIPKPSLWTNVQRQRLAAAHDA